MSKLLRKTSSKSSTKQLSRKLTEVINENQRRLSALLTSHQLSLKKSKIKPKTGANSPYIYTNLPSKGSTRLNSPSFQTSHDNSGSYESINTFSPRSDNLKSPKKSSTRVQIGYRSNDTSPRLSTPNVLLVKLHSQLSQLNKQDYEAHLQVYSDVFQLTIDQLGPYSQVLKELKNGYHWIMGQRDSANKLYQAEIHDLKDRLEKETGKLETLIRKFKKIAKENIDLSKQLEEWRSTDAHAEMKELISENRTLVDATSQMEHIINKFKARDKAFIRLFKILKRKGLPVDQLFQDLSKQPDQSDEDVNLPQNPVKMSPRPVEVPRLNIVLKTNVKYEAPFSPVLDELNSVCTQ